MNTFYLNYPSLFKLEYLKEHLKLEGWHTRYFLIYYVLAIGQEKEEAVKLEIMRLMSRYIDLHSWHSNYNMLFFYFNNWASLSCCKERKRYFIYRKHMLNRVDFIQLRTYTPLNVNQKLTMKIVKFYKLRKRRGPFWKILQKKV
mgnify:CR=1 FL=1